MNAVDIAVIVGILTPVLSWFWSELKKLRNNQETMWLGLVARGFIEAQKCGYVSMNGSKWWVPPSEARQVYGEVYPKLRAVYRVLKRKLDREPTDAEIGLAIEANKELHTWMIKNACPKLNLNDYGCIAVAATFSRESDETFKQSIA